MTERTITLTLPAVEATLLADATEEIPYLLEHAAGVFRYLWSSLSGGHLEGHTGILGILELSARALEAAANNEGVTISKLHQALSEATAEDQRTREARRSLDKGSASE